MYTSDSWSNSLIGNFHSNIFLFEVFEQRQALNSELETPRNGLVGLFADPDNFVVVADMSNKANPWELPEDPDATQLVERSLTTPDSPV